MVCWTTTLVRSTTRHGWSLLRYDFQHLLGCLTFPRDATLHQNTLESSGLMLLTNCLYSPEHLIQCRATVLSSQHYFKVTGKPSKASLTFDRRFTAM